jgi:hypothetical protein
MHNLIVFEMKWELFQVIMHLSENWSHMTSHLKSQKAVIKSNPNNKYPHFINETLEIKMLTNSWSIA